MADPVEPRASSLEFDGIKSNQDELDAVPAATEPKERPGSPGRNRLVDPRKDYREFDGVVTRET
jgi:hypothetical protein